VRSLSPPGQPPPTDDEVAAANKSLFTRNDPKVLAAVMRGLIQINQISGSSLRDNKVPTLALVGERDRRVQDVKRLAAVMSNLEVVMIPGATHATSIGMSTEHLLRFLGGNARQ
jgi:pimeloyl-ACP methyl ester carboxylesterase